MSPATDPPTFAATHPWLSVGALAAAVVVQSYLFYGKWQQRRRIEAKLVAESARPGYMPLASRPLWRRVRGGALFTAILPGAWAVPILLWCAFGGRYQKIERDDPFNADILELGIFYLLGSIWLGATIGACAPLMRGFVSRSLIGMAAVAPLIAGIVWVMSAGHSESLGTVLFVSMTVFFGLAIGHGAKRGKALTARSSNKDRLGSLTPL
jgi:hypothetical protein